jgi:hypothetical protein
VTCPSWCSQRHLRHDKARQHVSTDVLVAGMYVELIKFFDEEKTFIGLVEEDDGGPRVMFPIDAMPDLQAAVHQLEAA